MGCTMQLGHVLFSALDEDIWNRFSDRLYILPILSCHPTKIESVASLRSVRSEAFKEFKATSRDRERFAKYLDQIGSVKKHTFKGQLQLIQPVTAVPVMDKPVINAVPFKDKSRTVVKLERGEETNPIFSKKEVFYRKPLLWSQKTPAESTFGKIRNAWSQYGGCYPPF